MSDAHPRILRWEALTKRDFLPERHRDRVFLKLPFIYAATDAVQRPGSHNPIA